MPRWGIHLDIATKILDSNKTIDKNLFLFGNILPDIQVGYMVPDVSNIVKYDISHYELKNGTTMYMNFYKSNIDKMNEPIFMGYFTHLVADYCFNTRLKKQYIFNEQGDFIGYKNIQDEVIKSDKSATLQDKHIELEKLENYIYNKNKIELPHYESLLLNKSNEIENINIVNSDVEKAIKITKESKENPKFEEFDFNILTEEEWENEISNTLDIVKEFIK